MSGVPSRPVPRPRRALAHVAASGALLLDAGFLLLAPSVPPGRSPGGDPSTLGGFVLGATFPIVGWIIATRRPGNPMGWIFLAVGVSQALATFASQYAVVGLIAAKGSLPGADLAAWFNTWVWAPGFCLLLTATVLLFPDGRPPSPPWRFILWAAAVALGLLVVPTAITAWPSRGPDLVAAAPSPAALADPITGALLTLRDAGLILLLVASAASIVGLVIRFRRSSGAVRAQLKWFATAGLVEISVIVLTTLAPFPAWVPTTLLAGLAAPLLPIAAAIAIVRYRLYDIDRIISRTVAYALVTSILAGLFAVLVVTLQALLAPFTASSGLVVAGSTLVVAAAFQPLRRRIQSMVDRRFNRARLDAIRIEAALARGIRDQIDATAVVDALASAARGGLQPLSCSVWVRELRR